MRMVHPQIDMDELEDRDREVLAVLKDGRANPKLIRDETGLDKGDANTVLVRLGRGGLVRQVTRGLYEITDEGREEIGADGEARVEMDALQRALDDAEAAAERGDGPALQNALRRVRGAIGDG